VLKDSWPEDCRGGAFKIIQILPEFSGRTVVKDGFKGNLGIAAKSLFRLAQK
jgi:hypothetical protein